jgi:3-polyprenyl-4-hydroxybenzoate decarboxylase
VVGKPKQEDFYLGDYLQKLLAPIFPLVLPSVKSLWSYGETGYHSLSACIVRERYPREAMSSAFAILGQGQLSLTKFLLVLDQEMDLKDFLPVWQHILERADFSRDLFIFDHLSMDTLDYTGPEINKGSKAILAGLGKPVRKLARKLEKMPPWVTQARIFSPGCLVISTGKNFSKEKLQPTQMVKDPLLKVWTIIILADNAALCTKTVSSFLWTVFTRFEPAADIHSVQTKINRNTITFNAPLLFDCRMKPPYPDELFCDAKTASLVDQRWKEYFPQGMEMGDSDRAHLDKP